MATRHDVELNYSYEDIKTQRQLEHPRKWQNRKLIIGFHDSLLVFHYFENNSLIRTHFGGMQVPTRPQLEALQISSRHQNPVSTLTVSKTATQVRTELAHIN